MHPLSDSALSPNWNRAWAFFGCATAPLGALDADPPRFPVAGRLEEPSPKPLRPSDAPCRSRAPARRLLPRRPASAPCASATHEVSFTARVRIVPPSPRTEEPSPHSEKMEERLGTPFVVSATSCGLALDARGISASRLWRLATPDRIRHAPPLWRFGSVSAHRFARTPILLGTSAELRERLRAARLRPLQIARVRGDPPPSASAVSTDCFGLGPPSAATLAICREAGPWCVLTDSCFPPPLTSTRASLAPSISSRLAPRPWPIGLHPWPGDWGTSRFTTRDPLRRAVSGWRSACFFRALPTGRTSDTPVASPLEMAVARLSAHHFPGAAQIALVTPPWRWSNRCDPRCLPSIGGTRAPARIVTGLGAVTWCFRYDPALGVPSRACAALRLLGAPLAACTLDPRLWTLPLRLKWTAPASLGPTPPIDFCNNVSTTREHTNGLTNPYPPCGSAPFSRACISAFTQPPLVTSFELTWE